VLHAAVPNWQAGDTIPLGADRTLWVIEVRAGAEPDDDPVLVVEAVSYGARLFHDGRGSEGVRHHRQRDREPLRVSVSREVVGRSAEAPSAVQESGDVVEDRDLCRDHRPAVAGAAMGWAVGASANPPLLVAVGGVDFYVR